MKLFRTTFFFILAATLAFLAFAVQSKAQEQVIPLKIAEYTKRPPVTDKTISEGKEIYDLSCVMCHGEEGKGDGPTAFYLSREFGPRPRVFTDGVYKFRSTSSGELPTDEDLFRTVTNGVQGFMPSFAGLTVFDRWKVIYYIKTFSPRFKDAQPEVIELLGYPKPMDAASVQRGYKMFQDFKCWECHGGGGAGNGQKALDLKDDWGFPLSSGNLTMPSSFKNGEKPEDIARTIMTGLDGSGMPSYEDVFNSVAKPEDVWDLVNYIRSLSQEQR